MYLNKNNWLSRLYRWFYKRDSMPQNLCPYFWSLIFMWLTIIPISIFLIPSIILHILKYDKFDSRDERFTDSVKIYVLIFSSFSILSTISMIWTGFPGEKDHQWYVFFQIIGSALILVLISVFIAYLITKIKFKKKNESSIVAEFVKAKYNRYCPKIEWK